jgi:hypothetical protein
MDHLNDVIFENCLLCFSSLDVKETVTKINEKEPNTILNQLLEFWTLSGFDISQLNLVKNHVSKSDGRPVCHSCRIQVYMLYNIYKSNLRFVKLAFNGVTGTLESNTILIYSKPHSSLYTQNGGRMPH